MIINIKKGKSVENNFESDDNLKIFLQEHKHRLFNLKHSLKLLLHSINNKNFCENECEFSCLGQILVEYLSFAACEFWKISENHFED